MKMAMKNGYTQYPLVIQQFAIENHHAINR